MSVDTSLCLNGLYELSCIGHLNVTIELSLGNS
jgi:hypothetical protein